MALLLKSLIGAAVVILISLLSKSKYYYIAGLAPLFPTFALIAHHSPALNIIAEISDDIPANLKKKH